jgi:hypothetical protein
LVIRYSFLWPNDLEDEQKWTSEKDRPAVIVAGVTPLPDGTMRVSVLPITHSTPKDPAGSMEIPQSIKSHLGLDTDKSWVRFDEVNRFEWAGPDLRQIPGDPGNFAYGHLPPKFYNQLIERFREYGKERRIHVTDRDEVPLVKDAGNVKTPTPQSGEYKLGNHRHEK